VQASANPTPPVLRPSGKLRQQKGAAAQCAPDCRRGLRRDVFEPPLAGGKSMDERKPGEVVVARAGQDSVETGERGVHRHALRKFAHVIFTPVVRRCGERDAIDAHEFIAENRQRCRIQYVDFDRLVCAVRRR
jgi:hypothetical protein